MSSAVRLAEVIWCVALVQNYNRVFAGTISPCNRSKDTVLQSILISHEKM